MPLCEYVSKVIRIAVFTVYTGLLQVQIALDPFALEGLKVEQLTVLVLLYGSLRVV